jgi:hypothetical protein
VHIYNYIYGELHGIHLTNTRLYSLVGQRQIPLGLLGNWGPPKVVSFTLGQNLEDVLGEAFDLGHTHRVAQMFLRLTKPFCGYTDIHINQFTKIDV